MRLLYIRSLVLSAVSLAAVPSAFSATLIHDYQLQNSFSDSLGGPALVSGGGTLSAAGYSFNAQQGLSVSSAVSGTQTSAYSFAMYFSLTALTGYRKLIDFDNRLLDVGFYSLNSSLDFYNYGFSSTTDFTANTLASVVLTRDTVGTLTGYVNGVQKFSFSDSGNQWGVFTGPNNIVTFFQDDSATGGNESSGGLVKRLEIYDGALTATQVGALDLTTLPSPSATPEPSTWLLFGAGAVGLVFFRRIHSAF